MFHLKKCINNILSFAFYYFLLANVQVKKFPIHKRVPCYFRSFLKCYCAISTSRKKSQWLFNLDINYQYTAQSQPLTLQFVKICLKKLEIKVYTVENSKGFFFGSFAYLAPKGLPYYQNNRACVPILQKDSYIVVKVSYSVQQFLIVFSKQTLRFLKLMLSFTVIVL